MSTQHRQKQSSRERAVRSAYSAHIHRARRRREAGTVLLLVVFLAAAMLIAMTVAVPRLAMQGRRQREEEMAWRGEQYVRAVRLYYRKYGRFPRTVEDFSKNPGNLHFLRKEYKDPMNATDGSWRYIYVGPGGQLIGSLTRKLPLGLIPVQPGAGGASANAVPGGPAQQEGRGKGGTGQNVSQNPPGQPPQQPPSQPPTGDALFGAGEQSADASNLPPAPEAPKKADQGATTGDSTVYGGQIVGVGSKVDRKSIRFYKGYGKYREWEFIWDPAEEAAAAGGLVPATPGGQLPVGTQPIGTPPNKPPQ